jgi:NAD(P)-dependent dehydrogenase (short-subunit alcohol dehydrogenase family)
MPTVAITGSASGIGAACAERLGANGYEVIGIDRHGATVVADLGTPAGRQSAIGEVEDRCGGVLDAVVTCAGLAGAPSRAGSLLVSVNYFGTVVLMEGFRPLLARSPSPSAVAVSSNSTTIQPGVDRRITNACLDGDEDGAARLADDAGSMGTYPATKLAVAHWVRRHATGGEWAGSGIRLNAVAPGMVDTPLVAEGRADPKVAPLLEMLPIPIGRAGRPEEIAALIELLIGPDGGFFCGSVLFIDGGSDALLRTADWPAPWDIDLGRAAERLAGD